MSTLFAFLHHLCAFTLVSAVAIEFALIRQELTLSSARRLAVTDRVLGIAAGALLVIGLLRVALFEKGADYYFHSHAFLTKLSVFIVVGYCRSSRRGISVVARGGEGRTGPHHQREEPKARHRGHSRRAFRHRHHPALRRHHGARRVGLGFVLGIFQIVIPGRAPARTRNLERTISGFRVQP
jgi:Predicted membrane protein